VNEYPLRYGFSLASAVQSYLYDPPYGMVGLLCKQTHHTVCVILPIGLQYVDNEDWGMAIGMGQFCGDGENLTRTWWDRKTFTGMGWEWGLISFTVSLSASSTTFHTRSTQTALLAKRHLRATKCLNSFQL